MPTPTEPFREVIHQYTNTLCIMQRQTTLINSLLQDIVVFNEYNFTKLEDWLMDIETTVDLTNKCLVKKKRIYYGSNSAVVISIHIPHISWISNHGKRDPL